MKKTVRKSKKLWGYGLTYGKVYMIALCHLHDCKSSRAIASMLGVKEIAVQAFLNDILSKEKECSVAHKAADQARIWVENGSFSDQDLTLAKRIKVADARFEPYKPATHEEGQSDSYPLDKTAPVYHGEVNRRRGPFPDVRFYPNSAERARALANQEPERTVGGAMKLMAFSFLLAFVVMVLFVLSGIKISDKELNDIPSSEKNNTSESSSSLPK